MGYVECPCCESPAEVKEEENKLALRCSHCGLVIFGTKDESKHWIEKLPKWKGGQLI